MADEDSKYDETAPYDDERAPLIESDEIAADHESIEGRKVWFIRHGQSEHNEYQGSMKTWLMCRCWPCCTFDFPDASLTKKGRKQVEDLEKKFTDIPEYKNIFDSIDLVMTSPLSRACETTRAFLDKNDKPRGHKKMYVEPLIAELCKHPCDVGSKKSVLAAKFKWLNFDHIDEDWYYKAERPEKWTAFRNRINEFIDLLKARDEKVICVVGHSTFIRTVTCRTKLNNCCITGPYRINSLKHVTKKPPSHTQCANARPKDILLEKPQKNAGTI